MLLLGQKSRADCSRALLTCRAITERPNAAKSGRVAAILEPAEIQESQEGIRLNACTGSSRARRRHGGQLQLLWCTYRLQTMTASWDDDAWLSNAEWAEDWSCVSRRAGLPSGSEAGTKPSSKRHGKRHPRTSQMPGRPGAVGRLVPTEVAGDGNGRRAAGAVKAAAPHPPAGAGAGGAGDIVARAEMAKAGTTTAALPAEGAGRGRFLNSNDGM